MFFDPHGNLYTVDIENRLMRGEPLTTGQNFNQWRSRSTVIGQGGWLENLSFMSFGPDGKLWGAEGENGNLYRGAVSGDGRYVDSAARIGHYYNQFQFLCFTKDKTIRNIMSFEFLPDRGQRISESPEVIEERIYDNRRSSIVLKHTFSFDKTVKESSAFSHEHGFTFEAGTVFTVKAGMPAITAEAEATVQMTQNTSRNWSFTKTNETEVKFSSSSDVEVPPGRAIRMVASVVKAELIVPYKAKVRTLFGFETEIEGTWAGATHYNLMVVQEDYSR
ncbi:hypothetical protein GDO78_016361 [Eleutherodactylus coqui]|uniref:Tachylectin 2 domain-containing protein n=2 Tax=Eleutherodactylus coqui TaxID=57060 RepID=A0A8J6B9Q0_ELECQ|nr:hypothetical protein GDO78_016361 [Eleutherodactylus coqui]